MNDPALPRPRLTRLEHARSRGTGAEPGPPPVGTELTTKQRELLRALATTPSVSDAAGQLGVSRSNVYASLRRISRRLDVESVPDLLRRLRSGSIDIADG